MKDQAAYYHIKFINLNQVHKVKYHYIFPQPTSLQSGYKKSDLGETDQKRMSENLESVENIQPHALALAKHSPSNCFL